MTLTCFKYQIMVILHISMQTFEFLSKFEIDLMLKNPT